MRAAGADTLLMGVPLVQRHGEPAKQECALCLTPYINLIRQQAWALSQVACANGIYDWRQLTTRLHGSWQVPDHVLRLVAADDHV